MRELACGQEQQADEAQHTHGCDGSVTAKRGCVLRLSYAVEDII